MIPNGTATNPLLFISRFLLIRQRGTTDSQGSEFHSQYFEAVKRGISAVFIQIPTDL